MGAHGDAGTGVLGTAPRGIAEGDHRWGGQGCDHHPDRLDESVRAAPPAHRPGGSDRLRPESRRWFDSGL